MEKIIEKIEEDLRNIIEGKPPKILRKELGDMIDIRLLRMLNFSLQWSSAGYQSALRFAGMRLGRRIGEDSEKTEFHLVLEEIKKIIEFLRGGKVEIEMNPKSKEVHLKIYESSLTTGVPNVSQKLCFFEEGFIEGYFGGVLYKIGSIALAGGEMSIVEVNVEEKKCVGLGDEFCGFLIKF